MQVYPLTSDANSDSHAGLARCAKKNDAAKPLLRKLRCAENLTGTANPAASENFTRQYSHAELLVPDGSTDSDRNNSDTGSEFRHPSSIQAMRELPATMKHPAAAQCHRRTNHRLSSHAPDGPAADHRHTDTPASVPARVPPPEIRPVTQTERLPPADDNHSHQPPHAAFPQHWSEPALLSDQQPTNT